MGVRIWLALLAILIALPSLAQTTDPMRNRQLRVCADPDNLPFSNRAGEGFENRIAAVLAGALGRDLVYAWHPYGIGFLRQTLLRGRCDVALGGVRPHEGVVATRPYLNTGYSLLARTEILPAGPVVIDDPILTTLRIGVVTGSPPATHLAHAGIIGQARPYRPILDRRHDAPVDAMLQDLMAGDVQALAVWTPLANWAAARSGGALGAVPLAEPASAPRLAHEIGLTVRAGDRAWRKLLDQVLAARAGEIAAILVDYGLGSAAPQ